MDKFNTPEYIRSRNAYIVQQSAEYFVTLLVADVFLAKLLANVGMSDGLIGIISSFITLAFVFQILTLFIINEKTNAKKMVMAFDTISIFCFMFMFFVPFLPVAKTAKTVILMVLMLLAYLCKYLITNICFKWANSYVEPTKRGTFSAKKEMVSLFTGMIFSAVMGYIFDVFELGGNISGGFIFLAATILVLNVANFTSLAFIKKGMHQGENQEEKQEKEPLSHILKEIMSNKSFRSVIVVTILWDVARYFTVGFLGIFKSKDLLLSVFFVQVVNIIANFSRLLVSRPIGRYTDRNSFTKGFKLGLYLAGAAFFINMFTTKSTWFFIVVFTILYNCAYAGTNQNSFNMVYSYVDSKYIIHAMAIKNCIGGLFGFGASILGGKILDTIQANGNMIFGVHIYGQQVLSALSFITVVVGIVFITKVVEKQKIMIQ